MTYQTNLAPGQYDDHCRITFYGENWWILAVQDDLIILTNENGQTVMDVSNVNWDAYVRTACKWLTEETESPPETEEVQNG